MPRDTIGDAARDRADEKQQPSRLKTFLGDLGLLTFVFVLVLALFATRMHSIWLH